MESEVIKFKEYVSDKVSENEIESESESEKNHEMDKGKIIEPKERHLGMGGFRL